MYAADNWDVLWEKGTVQVSPTVDTSTATLIEKKTRETDFYGEYMEGEGEVYMIFQVGDRFFKKNGYQSSYYDDRTWDGEIIEVFPVEQTVTVFQVTRP